MFEKLCPKSAYVGNISRAFAREVSLCVYAVVAIFALLLAPLVLAQDPNQPADKPPGPTVALSLILTDVNKQPVKSVNKEDIRIIEEKLEQTLLNVDTDERPIDYALVIDSSGSLRQLLPASLEAARTMISSGRPSDMFFIERFISTDKIQRVQDFTDDHRLLNQALRTIQIESGQSAVLDAVYNASEYLATHGKTNPGRRRVLILISDCEDRKSVTKLDQAVKQLHKNEVQVFALALTVRLDQEAPEVGSSARDKAEKLSKTITEATGGRAFFPKTPGELLDAVDEIARNLQSQFRLTYQSSTPVTKEGVRKVEVRFNSPGGDKRKAIAPRGYYVNP